jgi:hypothetical protein
MHNDSGSGNDQQQAKGNDRHIDLRHHHSTLKGWS